MRWNRSIAGFATVLALALAAAACGGGSSSPGSSQAGGTQAGATQQAGGTPATIDVAKSSLGDILVDDKGWTLYLFAKDANGKSACTGECASAWPPVLVSGSPTVGDGLDAGLLGTTTRPDGTTQVTYNGHPLYRFSGDAKAGDTKGEGANAFGAVWYAVSPKGAGIRKKSGGGYGSY